MHLISFSLIISSNTSSLSLLFFFKQYQTDVFRIQTKAASFQLQGFSTGIARSCNTKVLLINHFLAKKMRSAQGFSNVIQQRGCSTIPPCLGVIRFSSCLPGHGQGLFPGFGSLLLHPAVLNCSCPYARLESEPNHLPQCTWKTRVQAQVLLHQNPQLETENGGKKTQGSKKHKQKNPTKQQQKPLNPKFSEYL